MNGKYSVTPWYGDSKMVDAVNRCMDAIELAGLSAERAGDVPDCLTEAIRKSNRTALSNAKFRAVHFKVEAKEGGYEIAFGR